MRIGHGYDAHRLETGRRLVLGGVDIPFEKGLLGHSDADVLTHAVIDALLGSAGLGDIGLHFPDNDPRYSGISSILLLKETAAMLSRSGWRLENIDATVLCQKPRLRPYVDQMRVNIAVALNCDTGRINVKATTEEGMGFTGSGEGISAHAVALIERV